MTLSMTTCTPKVKVYLPNVSSTSPTSALHRASWGRNFRPTIFPRFTSCHRSASAAKSIPRTTTRQPRLISGPLEFFYSFWCSANHPSMVNLTQVSSSRLKLVISNLRRINGMKISSSSFSSFQRWSFWALLIESMLLEHWTTNSSDEIIKSSRNCLSSENHFKTSETSGTHCW